MAKKWRNIIVRQELVTAAMRTFKENHYRSLSEFVSEAIRLHLDELKQDRENIAEKKAGYSVIRERLLYSPNHIWAMVIPEGNVRVGLSHYAHEHLKVISSIQIQPVGYKVKKGEPFGVVETWMFTFELKSPVSGKIIKINKVPQEEPFVINKEQYEITWIAEIKPDNLITFEEELRDLMRLREYKIWVSKLGRR